jgi:D-beta-D-heptose 7-phosphate kinase/D-beta-D-heptose 1-phosphate adenosyltransferase
MVKIAVIGDVILDKYDHCINRENQESSAPCYTVVSTEYKPGGAGNVAANLATLGSEVVLVGLVGKDQNARILEEVLAKYHIVARLILDDSRPTIVKERTLSVHDGRYHFRKDLETKVYALPDVSRKMLEEIRDCEVVLVSDYAKGAISEDFMHGLMKMGKRVFVEPKPEHTSLYGGAFMITPNIKEAKAMAKIDDELLAAENLRRNLGCRVLLTRSEKGVSYFGLNGETDRLDIPAQAREVFDVTGAGDTVVATLVHYHTKGRTVEEAIRLANKAAGIAVGHSGCYQVKESELE